MKLSLVVLAAGMGSRYGGLKQLDPVGPGGEILLDYSVAAALRAGFGKLVFVIRRDMLALFSEAVGARYDARIQVEYAFQEIDSLPVGFEPPVERTKPWGTGHALLTAAEVVNEPFAVINADDFYGTAGFVEVARFLGTPAAGHYAMIGYRLGKTLSEHGTVSRGICRTDEHGFLLDITERTAIARVKAGIFAEGDPPVALTGLEWTSMNFWGFTPDIFSKLEGLFTTFLASSGGDTKAEFYLPAAVSLLISTGEASVRLLHSDDPWLGLTYSADRPIVVEALAAMGAERTKS